MANSIPVIFFKETDDLGAPLSGGKLYAYAAGTNTPKTTYTDSSGTIATANPIVLNSAGRCSVWLGTGGYKFTLTDANDNLIWTKDNIGLPDTNGNFTMLGSISALRDLFPSYSTYVSVVLSGSYPLTYTWDATSSDSDNGWSIITPSSAPASGRWTLDYQGIISSAVFSSLNDAVTKIGTNINVTITINKTETLTGNLTIPSNITLNVLTGGLISGAYTLTLTGLLESNEVPIIASMTTLVFNSTSTHKVKARWFGSFALAVASCGSASVQLEVDTVLNIANDLTVPSTTKIVVVNGGGFTIANGKVLTINGNHQIYSSWFASFATAVASCGSTNVQLIVDTNQSITTSITAPINIELVVNATGTLAISGAGALVLANPVTLYPEWFGCKGDGTTDDGVAFKSAVITASVSGSVLKVNKSYLLTTWTYPTLTNKLILVGDGMTKSLITGPGQSTVFVYTHDQIDFRQFKITNFQKVVYGQPASGSTAPVGLINFDHVHIDNSVRALHLVGANGENIESGVRDLFFTNCLLTGLHGYPIEVYYKRIDNALFDGNRFMDFTSTGSMTCIMFGYDVINVGDTGSPGHANRKSVRVTNNHFENIHSTGGDGTEVQAVMIHEADQAIVSHNTIKDLSNQQSESEDCEGIYIRSVRRAIVQGNILYAVKAGEAFIDVKEFCEGAEILDNYIDGSTYPDLDESNGILCFIHNCTISGNKIYNVGGMGINVVDYIGTGPAHITNNVIENVGAWCGIFAYCSSWSVISGNTIKDCRNNYNTNKNYGSLSDTNPCGIYVLSPTDLKKYWNISNNSIHVDESYLIANTSGIRIITGIEESIISGNSISGVKTAIHADKLNGCLISGNRGTATVAGLVADAGTIGTYLDPFGVIDLQFGQGWLRFPATQVPSSGAHDLDDYAELNTTAFTPGISFGGVNTGITYATQSGSYTKIGRQVFFELQILLTNKGAATGAVLITGLPFTSSSASNGIIGFGFWDGMASMVAPIGQVNNSATTIALYGIGAATTAALTEANFTNTSRMFISGSYFV